MKSGYLKYLLSATWIILVYCLGYIPAQNDFLEIFLFYTPLFGLYLITYRLAKSHHDVLFFVFLAIVLRVLLILAFPNLSDDIYRFVWDGQLLNNGVNPYLYTPTEYFENHHTEESIFGLLYPNLNSPDYYSIYPPVCQVVFGVSVKIFPDSIFGAAVVMKIIILIAEIFTIYFLLKLVQLMRIPKQRVLLYALNPLVIIEFSGNLHMEALMILFLVMAFWFYMRQRSKLFSLSMAAAIGVKLLPLMFLPFFIRRFRRRKLIIGGLIIFLAIGTMFYPFYDNVLLDHLQSSLGLYFQKFEFNASIYYALRWLGYKIVGYNLIALIGPLLSLVTLTVIVILALFERPKKMQHVFRYLLLAFTTYLLLATTVHPWYLGIPIVLTLLTHYRYPIFWSALIMGTYINYAYVPYHENMWVVAIEYLVIFAVLITEVFRVPFVKILINQGIVVYNAIVRG